MSTNFDENIHEGLKLDGESESVLILKNSFCTVGQNRFFEIFKTKTFLTLFFTNFDINAHEGPSLDGESESVLILNFFYTMGKKNDFLDFFNKNSQNFVIYYRFR